MKKVMTLAVASAAMFYVGYFLSSSSEYKASKKEDIFHVTKECSSTRIEPLTIGPDNRRPCCMLISYDSKCDNIIDAFSIQRLWKKDPIIYMYDKDRDGHEDEFYLDNKEDGFNGNEVKCLDLEDCVNQAFFGIKKDYKTRV